MSSPNNAGVTNASPVIREGTRVILREITANLQNSPPAQSPRRKSGNETTTIKGEQQQQQQHDVKVRFIREFADVGASGTREANTESSLSSASSFQSLTSTLSSKCSSGICVDSSPAKASEISYTSADISGLDDLIAGCENIRLTDKTLDLSKDQSFNLQLDGEDLSGDQTFTSAVDRNSLDRTREILPINSPEVGQKFDKNRTFDGEKDEISEQNDFFECGTSDIVEASRFLTTNPEVCSAKENFVECVSNVEEFEENVDGIKASEKGLEKNFEVEKSVDVGEKVERNCDIDGDKENSTNDFARCVSDVSRFEKEVDEKISDKPEVLELGKIDETREKLEFFGNEKKSDNEENSIFSIDERVGKSNDNLESISKLSVDEIDVEFRKIEKIERTRKSEDTEKSAKSLLNVTFDDLSKNSEIIENSSTTRRSEVAEKSAESILNVTVDISNDLKKIVNVEEKTGEKEICENPKQSILDVTVDLPTNDSKKIEAFEKPAGSILDVTVDFTSDSKLENFQSNEKSEIAENSAKFCDISGDLNAIKSVGASELPEIAEISEKSDLNVTVDIEKNLQQIDDIKSSDFQSKSHIATDDILSVNSELCKPSTPSLSELNDNSECPTLPTLSSICLIENDVPLIEKKSFKNVENRENIEKIEISTLSEKFDNLAAIGIPPGNSISTIQEPTFLKAQKFVEESVLFADNSITDKTVESDIKIVKNTENFIEKSSNDKCDFKKPKIPSQTEKTKISSPKSPKKEEEGKKKNQFFDSIETKKNVISDLGENHETNSSTESDNLDETVTIQDISSENIFAAPESDQYAEFLPQQQSTKLTIGGASHVVANSHDNYLLPSASLTSDDNLVSKPISFVDEYAAFVPQQQSTALTGFNEKPLDKLERQPTPFVTANLPSIETTFCTQNDKSPEPTFIVDDACNFEKLEIAAKAVANDIYNTSLGIEDDNNSKFVSATSELFHDAGSFDFLLSKTPRKHTFRDLRAESLYVKFDPLVSNTSMLPQGNIQNTSPPMNAERNGDNNTTITNIGTPKRNPAIAAIDRLLFYSPMTTNTTPTTNTENIQKANDSQEKVESKEETSAETLNMAKELELVRSTVIQLEEQLEKLKIDHEEALEKQSSYEDKINQLQAQLAQEIKNKNQITVVVDEYEKSISRLVAEKEHDRKNLDIEKAKLIEELAAAKRHLENSEAAFNDVHLKYERLKAVAAAYKSNEIALKKSAQENIEIIKSLEIRNAQVKEYATAQLEKANQDLDAMLKKHESETVRLNAMVRKAELKSNSLAELVEQKTKENKELTGILDEVIARVGRTKSEGSRNFHPDSS